MKGKEKVKGRRKGGSKGKEKVMEDEEVEWVSEDDTEEEEDGLDKTVEAVGVRFGRSMDWWTACMEKKREGGQGTSGDRGGDDIVSLLVGGEES